MAAVLRRPVVTDGVVALVALGLTLALLAGAHGATRRLDALGGVLAAAACLPLLARRRDPLAVFAVTTGASATLNGLGYALGPPFGPTIALFFVAADARTRTRLAQTGLAVAALYALHVGATAAADRGFPTSAILFGIVVWGGAWIAGDLVRQRRQRLADALERTEQTRRMAAAEERTRIARDLHDSAAHAINVILVQAGAARLLQDRDPAAARAALGTIEDVARETVGEIDRLVTSLRDDDRDGVEPPTGLAALDTLVARSGVDVDLDVTGAERPLPPRVDQAAYRILQESLTNAARHGSGSARVRVDYGAAALRLAVDNPRRNGVAPGSGHGILGMRERATLLGGTLDAGASPGGFHVEAVLPYAHDER